MNFKDVQRDLLVSYLSQGSKCSEIKSCEECSYNNERNCVHRATADHLISKHVIAMPCKMYGTLWCVRKHTDCDGKSKRVVFITKTRLSEHNFYDVAKGYGITYFRTKAEAQKAYGIKNNPRDESKTKKRIIHLCNTCCTTKKECPWRSSLEPVNGWKASKIRFKYGQKTVNSYKVIACPLYKSQEKKES